MDVVLMIVYAVILLGILVFIHEGGHYVASRLFGVRVTEFMLGLPGPSVGFVRGGTRFGVTALPLGGYARVCGMEAGDMSPHLQPVLAALYRRGTANMEDIAYDCGISDDDALYALDELVEWGSITGPKKQDQYNTYRTPAFCPTKAHVRKAEARGLPEPVAYHEGDPRPVADADALFQSEYRQQYRSLPFWKRSVILLAGVFVNLLFAMVMFVVVFSVIGMDYINTETGEVFRQTLNPLQSIQMGFMYIGAVVEAVVGLFNPATAAETVQSSASIVGIAVMAKGYADAGLVMFLFFMAAISVSLGVMNLLPVPPLDGGRFLIEIGQKLTGRNASNRLINVVSTVGMLLFLGFFLIMVNQDIQRILSGFWG